MYSMSRADNFRRKFSLSLINCCHKHTHFVQQKRLLHPTLTVSNNKVKSFDIPKSFKIRHFHRYQLIKSDVIKDKLQYPWRWKLPNQGSLLLQSVSSPTSAGHRCLSTSTQRLSPPPVDYANQFIGATVPSSVPSHLWVPDFPTIHLAEYLISCTHELTGLPWWSTIMFTTVIARLGFMMLPAMYTDINMARLQRLTPELDELSKGVRENVLRARKEYGWSDEKTKKMFAIKMKDLAKERYLRDNCHPWKSSAIFWFQLPLWLSISFSLRNMCTRACNPQIENHSDFIGYTTEGIAWISDLTQVDHTFVLPVLMGVFTLFNVEMMYLNMPKVTRGKRLLVYTLRGFSVFLVYLSSLQPSAMVLYWTSSAVCATGQTLLFNYSPFRRLFKLPQTTNENNSPVRCLLAKVKAKYSKS